MGLHLVAIPGSIETESFPAVINTRSDLTLQNFGVHRKTSFLTGIILRTIQMQVMLLVTRQGRVFMSHVLC